MEVTSPVSPFRRVRRWLGKTPISAGEDDFTTANSAFIVKEPPFPDGIKVLYVPLDRVVE
jgi:hypothetical protein